ncbi:hypothetical protein GCM10008967_03810 [Bacillus carboniphilus]|uniref:Class D sortase n=1 Tax=Bacillus carboniphilus TaxID=86663 RepID=A0ABP3FGT2_9BACI
MTFKKIITWILGATTIIATILTAYYAFQIFSDEKKIKASLEEWESLKETARVEAPPHFFRNEEEEKKTEINEKSINETATSSLYPTRPKLDEVIGKIIIPSIDLSAPIVEGTGDEQLAKGVGHYSGSVLPGEHDNTVLSGHNNTVFSRLGSVEKGDKITIETSAGTFNYRITEQKIVDEDDRTIIVPYDHAILTIITCYPLDFIGPTPDRYILIGELIEG